MTSNPRTSPTTRREAVAVGNGILIVDDEADLVETCVRLLERHGFTCLRAHTGQEGIALIEREHPRLVLTDLYLPDIDGLSVLRHARERSPSIPGILMTAYTSPRTVEQAYGAGAVHYLSKPFANSALLDAVGRALQ
jgi:CheY-like chemotaxis protein